MTWYWWTHWFWITCISAKINCIPFGAVNTSSTNPNQEKEEIFNKREPLKFPIAAQSDADDIFDGKEIIDATFNEEWISSPDNISPDKVNKSINDTMLSATLAAILSKDNETTPHVINKISSSQQINNTSNSFNNSSFKINTTSNTLKDVDNIPKLIITNTTPLYNKYVQDNISKHSFKIAPEQIDVNSEYESTRNILLKEILNNSDKGRQSKLLAEYKEELKIVNFTAETKSLLARAAIVSINTADASARDLNSEAYTVKEARMLDAGAISGICFAVIGLCCAISATGVFLYRRRYINNPQTLSEPDSSGYIDDSTMRDNSDEMYSLDNDSFLNSLEAMTIQNYWTDNVKHTKL